MLFRTVDGVMLPSTRLLHTDGSPFIFGKETCFWKSLCEFFGKNDMSVVWLVMILYFRFHCKKNNEWQKVSIVNGTVIKSASATTEKSPWPH